MDREEVARHAEEIENERQRKLKGLLSVLKEPDFVSPELTIKNSPLHQEAHRMGIESVAHYMRVLEAQRRAHRRRMFAAVLGTAMLAGLLVYGYYWYQNAPQLVRGVLGIEGPSSLDSPYVFNGRQGGKHTVLEGDSLWRLSDAWYRQGYLWPAILRANPQLEDPDLLSISAVVNIPALEDAEGNPTRERGIVADGYVAAYNSYKKLERSGYLLYLWAARLHDQEVVERLEGEIDASDIGETDVRPPLPEAYPAQDENLEPQEEVEQE